MKKPSLFPVIIATGFGSGFSPFAPGTAGALVASLIWILLYSEISYNCLLLTVLLLIFIFTLVGVWSIDQLEPFWGEDPSKVVVDEMVGVWIALLAVPDDEQWYLYLIGAFILFRLLDIFKPLGIRRMERLKGGVGVMMDDILAGVYSLIVLMLIRWAIG